MSSETRAVLSLYPNRYGVSFAVFNGPKSLVSCGQKNIFPISLLDKTMDAVKECLQYFEPTVVVLRNSDPSTGLRSKRIATLLQHIEQEAASRKLHVTSYRREDIQTVFSQFEAGTKYDISRRLIEWFPELDALAFEKRKIFEAESYRSSIMDSVALGITHYYLTE